jgi:hypothetical protein
LELIQATCNVMSAVVPSLYVPVATSCALAPSGMKTGLGVIMIAVNTGGGNVAVPIKGSEAEVLPATALSAADLIPDVVGTKFTCAVQLAPGASPTPHVLALTKNCVASKPVNTSATAALVVPPVFVTVNVAGALVAPTEIVPKLPDPVSMRLGGSGNVAVPANNTVAETLPATALNVADLFPAVVGTKLTCAVQLAPGASPAPHVLPLTMNCVASRPVSTSATVALVVPPVFVTVSVAGALVAPTEVVPKIPDPVTMRLGGNGNVAVPVSGTVVEMPPPDSVSVAVFAPTVVGAKLASVEQLAPTGRIAGAHVLPDITN